MTSQALILRNMTKEDVGNYICVATSAGVFYAETTSNVEVKTGGRQCLESLIFPTNLCKETDICSPNKYLTTLKGGKIE